MTPPLGPAIDHDRLAALAARGGFRARPVAFVVIGAVTPAADDLLGADGGRHIRRRRRAAASLDGRRICGAGGKNESRTPANARKQTEHRAATHS